MNKAFFINGGAGRVLCSIPALERYAETHEDFVIVSESWDELYLNNPVLRDKTYSVGHKGLFEEHLKDKKIVSPEPYRINQYFNQECNLIQAFDIEINELDEVPETRKINLDLSKADQVNGHNIISEIKAGSGKDKIIVIQPFGQGTKTEGNFIFDSSGRSMEVSNLLSIIEKLKNNFGIALMSEIEIPGWTGLGIACPKNLGLNGWMGVINAADYFLGCDSVGQHMAYSLDKPTTVVVGSTFPENISYPDSKKFTIIDNGKGKRRYSPIRLTWDLCIDRVNEDAMVLSDKTIDQLVKGIKDKIGISKKTSADVGLSGIPSNLKPQYGDSPTKKIAPINFGTSKSITKKKKKPIDELLDLETIKS